MAITDTIDKSIEELIRRLTDADAVESARIHARLDELEKLKENRTA